MDMEKDITILKNLWQTFAGSASDKENMSKGSIKEGMTESNCAIERNCVTDYTCATGQNCGTEQNCGTDQSIVGESTP